MEYGDGYQSEPQLKNIIDLLARSADYPGDGRILYEDRRGRWRFDADLVNFNEIEWDDGSENKPNIMREQFDETLRTIAGFALDIADARFRHSR